MRLQHWTLMGCLLAGLAVLGITSSHSAAAPRPVGASNKDKIIGVWEITAAKDEEIIPNLLFEFAKDGKLKVTAKLDDQTINMEGTYKVEKDKLKTAITEANGNKVEDTDTIQKLTDTEMILKDTKGKIVKLKKKKNEK